MLMGCAVQMVRPNWVAGPGPMIEPTAQTNHGWHTNEREETLAMQASPKLIDDSSKTMIASDAEHAGKHVYA